ncbi:MAG: M48 family metalloprotease [Pseudomonadota bacterium]|nr:M48 family metalloprotease [Pseudomonadota bacterium]
MFNRINTMDFFTRQYQARTKTHYFIVYFLLAVLLILSLINIILMLIGYLIEWAFSGELLSWANFSVYWFHQPYWIIISALIFTIILSITLIRVGQLRQGGGYLAEQLGAQRIILAAPAHPNEQKLIEVTSKMAIATGMPAPVLYCLPQEQGINIFVLGYNSSETALIVTAGALTHLNERELQNLVSHELNHILHGDIYVNMYVLGSSAGILFMGRLGLWLQRQASKLSRLLGLLLFIVGYSGLFAARLLKAWWVRPQIYTADIAAIQFTQDAAHLINALEKIIQYGSELNHPYAEEISHMGFAASTSNAGFPKFLMTHPPLAERIQSIQQFNEPQSSLAQNCVATPDKAIRTTADQIVASVGNPTAAHLDYASTLHATILKNIILHAHTLRGAKCILYALLMAETRQEKAFYAQLRHHESEDILTHVIECKEQINLFGSEIRLPLIDLVLPTLKKLRPDDRSHFLATLEQMMNINNELNQFEFVLQTILKQRFSQKPQWIANKIKYQRFKPVLKDISLILSALAQAGSGEHSYRNSLKTFTERSLPLIPLSDCTPEKLAKALNKVARLSPPLKKNFLDACARCILADGVVRVGELELLRAIAESLDCPMPPLIMPLK